MTINTMRLFALDSTKKVHLLESVFPMQTITKQKIVYSIKWGLQVQPPAASKRSLSFETHTIVSDSWFRWEFLFPCDLLRSNWAQLAKNLLLYLRNGKQIPSRTWSGKLKWQLRSIISWSHGYMYIKICSFLWGARPQYTQSHTHISTEVAYPSKYNWRKNSWTMNNYEFSFFSLWFPGLHSDLFVIYSFCSVSRRDSPGLKTC